MAEIHVERKGSRSWLWLLVGLAILLALAAWLVWGRGGDAPSALGSAAGGSVAGATAGDTAGMATGDTTGAAGAGAIGSFLSYVEETRARQAAGPSHEYTADGVRRLAAAIAELSQRNPGTAGALRAELDAVRAQADSLQRNPQSTEHARYTREAFRAAAGLMGALQQRHYSNLSNEVAEVRRAADAVQPDRPLLEQVANVQRFFDQSAAALRAMMASTT